ESVGSFFPRVILIDSNSVEVPVAPEARASIVALPVRVLELDTHSSSKVDPSESSPPPVSVAPMVSPFLCSDDSESDTEIPKRHVSHTTSTPEISTTPILPAPSAIVALSSEYPFAPVVAPPGIRRGRAIPIRTGEDIPIGRLYRTHPGHSSVDHSSSGHSISGHSLSGHASPDTTIVDSSTPSRFVYPPLSRTLLCSEAYLRWRFVPLSTMYPPTTSESSTGDSSSESSARPSHKRCRSPATTLTSSIHAARALVPSRVDLLPPRKRFKDSISPKDSVEEDINTDVLEDIKADATAVERTRLRTRSSPPVIGLPMEEVGVDVVFRIDIPDAMLMPDAVEHLEHIEEQDIYEHVIRDKKPLQRIEDIKTGQ
ncbi:hypothetical protein Tco_0630287, partial [Tanacetum coccineum]